MPWDQDLAREIAEELKAEDGALLPILHALNERFGYVDQQAVPVLAGRIVAHREQVGGFDEPAQLREVSGIGESTWAALRDLVAVAGAP